MTSEQETVEALGKFRGDSMSLADQLIETKNGGIVCRIASESSYQDSGRLLVALRLSKKRWDDWLKKDPGKPPSECKELEGVYFFAYQNWERARKLVKDGHDWFELREQAVVEAIRGYDATKQEELRRKQEREAQKRREAELAAERAREAEEKNRLEAERQRQAAEAAQLALAGAAQRKEKLRLEEQVRIALEAKRKAEAEQFRQRAEVETQERARRDSEACARRLAEKMEEMASGPEGIVKVAKFVPCVLDKAAFFRWVCRTENWRLISVNEGELTKRVNALAGQNLPDGVAARREDIIRRASKFTMEEEK